MAAVSTELAATPPEWVHLMPLGEVRTRPHDGRPAWHLKNADSVAAATRAVGLPIVVDYEHQTEHTKRNGQPAPAAGWITDVEPRADGLWGAVEWTDRARSMIASREYRFLSPVFAYHPKTREVRSIVMAGLTNDRALADIRALAKSEDSVDELLKKMRAALGLADDASEDAVVTAATKAAEAAKGTETATATAVAPIAKALGLAEDAKPADVETAAAKAAKDTDTAIAAAVAPIAKALGLAEGAKPADIETAAAKAAAGAAAAGNAAELAARLKTLEDERATDRATADVDAAIKAGKLIPAQRDWAMGYAKKDGDAFAKFIEAQPVVVASGGSGPGGRPGGGRDGLGADELAVCRAMGLTPEEYQKSRTAIAEREQEEAA